MEEYNKTKNLVTAYDYANVIVPKTPKEERFQDVSTYQVKTSGSSLYVIKQKIMKDRFGILPDKQEKPEIEVADKDQADAITLSSMRSNFNFATQAKSILYTEHLEDFVREVGKQNIQLTNIASPKEYGKVSDIFQNVMERDGALKDQYNDDLSKTLLNALVSNNTDIVVKLASEDKDAAFDILEQIAEIAE